MNGYHTQYGTGHYNVPLFKLRASKNMTQCQLAKKIGFTNQTVSRIEKGLCGGKLDFWLAIQKLFEVPDEDMWALMNGKESV